MCYASGNRDCWRPSNARWMELLLSMTCSFSFTALRIYKPVKLKTVSCELEGLYNYNYILPPCHPSVILLFFLPSIHPTIRLVVHPSLISSICSSINSSLHPSTTVFSYFTFICTYVIFTYRYIFMSNRTNLFYRDKGFHSLRELEWIRINNIKLSLYITWLLFELWEQ